MLLRRVVTVSLPPIFIPTAHFSGRSVKPLHQQTGHNGILQILHADHFECKQGSELGPCDSITFDVVICFHHQEPEDRYHGLWTCFASSPNAISLVRGSGPAALVLYFGDVAADTRSPSMNAMPSHSASASSNCLVKASKPRLRRWKLF